VNATPKLRVRRDLGENELWERSLERSLRRRAREAEDEDLPRSLVSLALLDLDGPVLLRAGTRRDLTDPELWDISQARARWKRKAAEPGTMPQARMAGATLVVAAVAAALPVSGSAHGKTKGSGVAEVRAELLRVGSRGPAVAKVQRTLGIEADGIFGPKTRAAVKAFQRSHGLVADGISLDPRLAELHRGAWMVDTRGSELPAALPAQGEPRDYIYVIDPLGNLMMRYPRDADPNGMKKDFVRLLKVSRIG
jgi:hypothetical protein